MYCNNCGNDVGEYKFCPVCGSRVSEENAQSAADSMRKQSLQVLGKAYKYFNVKKDEFDEKDYLECWIYKRETTRKWLIFMMIAILLLIFGMMFVSDFTGWGVSMIAASVIYFAVYVFNRIKFSKNKARFAELKAELDNYYDNYEGLCPVGPDYCYPETIKALAGYVKDGRAYTVRDALNCYEDDNHRSEVMGELNQIKGGTEVAATLSGVAAVASIFRD